MDAPKMKVRCSVENCRYNRDRMCHADSLDIDAMAGGRARSSEGTCCSTFIEG